MVELIKRLLKAGLAYKGEDGSIYYNVAKFKGYGKLAGIKVKELKAGARVKQDSYTKEEAQDFALWKAWDAEDGNVFWDTEIGKGRPGWHIECSAMSMKYLGETFDIHGGGIDLVFPHHQNEIAQSEGATGKKFANYWFHNEWLLVDGKKMSKSLGNFYTLRDVLAKGYNQKAVRYLLMNAHYRSQLNFTFEELKKAQTTVDRMLEFIERLNEYKPKTIEYNSQLRQATKKARADFVRWMDDDLAMPEAMAVIFEYINVVNKALAEGKMNEQNVNDVLDQMEEFDAVLGLLEVEKEKVPAEIKKLLKEREKARKAGDFKKADSVRTQIRKMGWEVQDTPAGQKVRKKL
jgi:cysteinyl-tRNA synthetase